jgi:hypothetical protein
LKQPTVESFEGEADIKKEEWKYNVIIFIKLEYGVGYVKNKGGKRKESEWHRKKKGSRRPFGHV